MDRRKFLQSCVLGSALDAAALEALAASAPRAYARVRLVDGRGEPVRARRASPGSVDEVQEASEESFLASDAPSWTAPKKGELAS